MRSRPWFRSLLAIVALGTTSSSYAGPLRDRIRARIADKLESEPAPSLTGPTSEKIGEPGLFTFALESGGRTRYYMVYVSTKHDFGKPAPLALFLHGGGGDMRIQSTDRYYRIRQKAEDQDFVAVFPNGVSKFKSGHLATWNAGHCCALARDENVDDVAFLKKVVSTVSTQISIDPTRVFAAGMSNGAMMAYRLACDASDVFKAIAAVAGTDNTTSCKPTKPVSILHIHAKDDDHVLVGGGAGKTFRDPSMVTNFAPVASTIEKWVKQNGCEAKPIKVLEKPGATCEEHAGCREGRRVEVCLTDTGGHSWPGGEKPRGVVGAPSNAISATDMIWSFFSK